MLTTKTVTYGAYALTCACDADQNLWISLRDMSSLTGLTKRRVGQILESKQLEAALGKDYSRVKTEAILEKAEGQTQKVKLIPLDLFVMVLNCMAFTLREGQFAYPGAQAIVASGFATDIKGTILKEFGHSIEIDSLRLAEQFRWLRVFQLRAWTDTIRDRYLALYGVKPSSEYYRDLIVMVNLALFDCSGFQGNRDAMTSTQQELIHDFEKMLVHFAKRLPDLDPKELICRVLPLYSANPEF